MTKVRIAVIGAGWWATTNHLPLLADNPQVELVALCSLGKEELTKVKDHFGFEFATEDLDEFFAYGSYDGVVVASPHNWHFEHARRALEAGAHVMVEKPMTTDPEQATILVEAAKKANREILVPHGWNFTPYIAHARALIGSGRIGEIRHIAMQMASPAEALFSGEPYPGTEDHMFRPPESTWADPSNSGGYGWGQFPHVLGCLFEMAEQLEPDKVFALSGSSPTNVDLYDAVSIRFANGATASLSGSGTVPMNSPFQVDIRLFGTEGMLLLDLERERLSLRRNDDENEDFEIEPGQGDYSCVEPVHRFVSICSGADAVNAGSGSVALRATKVIEAMHRSIKSGSLENIS